MKISLCLTAAAVALVALLLHPAHRAYSQAVPSTMQLTAFRGTQAGGGDRPYSNSAVELFIRGDSVWVGGGKGLDLTTDGGATWRHFGAEAPFQEEAIAALDGAGPVLWASLAGSYDAGEGTRLPDGRGLAVSTDNGATWRRIEQPREKDGDTTYTITYGANTIRALAVTTTINNITYDIAVTPSSVWTASFAGGLRRSTDGGATFHPVVLPPDTRDSISETDTLDFELSPVDRTDFWNQRGDRKSLRGNFNHRVFSVMALDDSTLFVGTARGINITTNAGRSWRRVSHDNQQSAISGDFVVALGHNIVGGVEHVWAATINATQPQEYRAVSVTTDRGRTWRTALRGEFTNNFGFKGVVAYAAASGGMYRSDDGGRTWSHYTVFSDPVTRNRATATDCYAVAAQAERIWIANADALMTSEDSPSRFFGTAWQIFRAAQPLASPASAYAYPNPFSPDDEVCRIRYRTDATGRVSITVYDFAMFPVRTIVRNASRAPEREQDEIWDGRTDGGARAANGVYYIEVKAGDADPAWTKVIVLQ